jgi:predicted Zn-dependent peptidase
MRDEIFLPVQIEVLVRADDLNSVETGAVETLAGALLGETENYSLNELKRLAWAVGGSISTTFAGDCVRLSITTSPERLNPTAALISDALRKPAFTPESLASAQLAARGHQDWVDRTPPLRDLFTSLSKRDLAPTPLTTLTREQAVALHSKVFRPERVAIAVVGDITVESASKALGASLGLWGAPEAPRAPAFSPDPPRKASAFQSAIATVEGPTVKAQDYVPWLIACIAFAEGKGSFLNQEFRVRTGQSYLHGGFLTFRSEATFCTFFVSSSGDAVAGLSELVIGFRPSPEAIRRAKAFLAGRYLVGGPTESGRVSGFSAGHETQVMQAFWLAWWEMRGVGIKRDAQFAEMVVAATDEEVLAARAAWKPVE